MAESGIVFSTVHGSHLYGFAHGMSDMDYFEVTLDGDAPAHQTFDGYNDVTTMGWRTFLRYAMSGSHQSAEALFSPAKIWSIEGLKLAPLFDGVRLGGGDVTAKYERTIRKFAYGEFKKRRHAARLTLALRGIRQRGRFNPALEPMDQWWCNLVAEQHEGDALLELLEVPHGHR